MNLLNETDYAGLEKSYLTREIADSARVQRVPTDEGARLLGARLRRRRITPGWSFLTTGRARLARASTDCALTIPTWSARTAKSKSATSI
jgi:hypothetical protein